MRDQTHANATEQTLAQRRRNYHHERGNRFRIECYDEMPGFCSFLPGIAGAEGVPLWCMYVNRAQAVVSFGRTDKDHPIAEFLPATWAYQLVGIQGFRTFCKANGRYYEPFQKGPALGEQPPARTMWIEPDGLSLEEKSASFGLTFRVDYFGIVNRTLPGLVRRLTVTNDSPRRQAVELLDGLPLVIPAGFTDFAIKKMRHIMEAYAAVRLLERGVPFYASKVQTHDEAEVTEVSEGNFYAAWRVGGDVLEPVEPLVDPDVVFGHANDLLVPRRFIAGSDIDRSAQVWENRLPCALVPLEATLEPGQAVGLIALAGAAPDEAMVAAFRAALNRAEDFDALRAESAALVEEVTRPAFTASALPTFDGYARQNYLDNVLRGGLPIMLPSRSGPTPLHLYSRRHGDLERDYNHFVLAPHPLSDGPGNYRDICQNRRHDVWFYPQLFDEEIRMFLGLLQPDGFNPLSVTGYRWMAAPDGDVAGLCPVQEASARDAFRAILGRPFSPGELLAWADRHGVHIQDRHACLAQVLQQCDRKVVAGGHEGGYWIDHWTYIVDLLEALAGIWPDRVRQMLTERADVGWFDEGACVLPRRDKYVLRPCGPLQLGAVRDGPRPSRPLPPVTPLAKLCALLAIKAVSLDYEGRGMEMEAGRPAWNDAMNGLPGLFGSSPCETAEAARLAGWLRREVPDPPDTQFPEEVANLIAEVARDLERPRYGWGRAAGIRERFRARVRAASGSTRFVSGAELSRLLYGIERRMLGGVEASVDGQTGLMHTYYRGIPLNPKPQGDRAGRARRHPATGSPLLRITRFRLEPLSLFLEGQVHRLRLLRHDPEAARRVYRSVRASGLFDQQLQMYKLNEDLGQMPREIGRVRTFSRGWFENESVWLHMSYKYLIELLRCGLHREFFDDAETMLMPFMDPAVYGRSILENSSFIACSACPDPETRGRGFIARLSGSTAEFIHIWNLLTVGERPFRQASGAPELRLCPLLPGAWFTQRPQEARWRGDPAGVPANAFACAFLGDILLVYHNESRRDTFGAEAVRPVKWALDGQLTVQDESLKGALAERVRGRGCRQLEVWLG